jgi:hypothetical protein
MLTKKPAGKIVKKITIPKIGITQPVKIRHLDVLQPEPAGIEAAKINFDVFKKLKNAPDVAISVEPKDGNFLLYHPTPGFTSNETPLAQLSVLALIRNKGTVTIDLDKVILEYKKGTKTIKKSVLLPSDKLIIEPGKLKRWQNSREYHEPGDVLFLESAFPNKFSSVFILRSIRTR